MREIKFRAWDRANKIMAHSSCSWGGNVVLILEPNVLVAKPSDTVELMQYTGLQDKNGKEIYEGDILGFYDGYKPNKVCIQDIFRFYEQKCGKVWDPKCVEIIGNIYENPDLLKK